MQFRLNKPFYLLTGLFLFGCSNEMSPNSNKLSRNLYFIPSDTVISVVAKNDHKFPKHTEIIEEPELYVVLDNVYDQDSAKILVPKGAIMTGVYSNDGVTCKINWQALYANQKAYKDKQGTLSLKMVTKPSFCEPQREIKEGNRLTVRFK